jgi:two-component system cell cycle response regulator
MSARVVIVDRAASERIMLRAMLTRAFYDVAVCADLAEAAAALAEKPAEIILAAAEEVRALGLMRRLEGAAAATLIALAKPEDERGRVTALQAGAEDVLARDAGEALILATIRRHLRKRAALRDRAFYPESTGMPGFAETQTRIDPPPPAFEVEDATGPIAIISTRATGLPRSIRMLIERHPGPVEVAHTPAAVERPAALYIVDGGGFPVSGLTSDGLYRTVAELEVRARAEHAATLVLVPPGAEHLGAIALDLGAEEQVADAVTSEELTHRVRRLLRRKAQEDRHRDRLQTTIAAATLDPLTGLCNRRHAVTRLETLAAAARDSGAPLAVMMLDIDHFKSVNDTHGHATGDRVLVEVARRLRDNLRAIDLVARIGGEEFLVAMPETSVEQARGAAERLRRVIEDSPFDCARAAQGALRVTMSIGVAIGPMAQGAAAAASTGALIEELYERADIALYSAKSAGRNTVTVELTAA